MILYQDRKLKSLTYHPLYASSLSIDVIIQQSSSYQHFKITSQSLSLRSSYIMINKHTLIHKGHMSNSIYGIVMAIDYMIMKSMGSS